MKLLSFFSIFFISLVLYMRPLFQKGNIEKDLKIFFIVLL